MEWTRVPVHLLEIVNDPEIIDNSPPVEVEKTRYYWDYKTQKSSKQKYMGFSSASAAPKTGEPKLTLRNSKPVVQWHKGAPYNIDTHIAVSRAYWLSKDPELILVGYKMFGWGGGRNMSIYRRDKDNNWTRTNRRSKAVKKALRRLMLIEHGQIKKSTLYDPY